MGRLAMRRAAFGKMPEELRSFPAQMDKATSSFKRTPLKLPQRGNAQRKIKGFDEGYEVPLAA
jgi:hypothetical protein